MRRKLVDRSLDAYVLALETINRVSLRNRVEVFTYLVCNAWELLLKARIVELRGPRAIYYPRSRGQPRRSLALRDCLTQLFTAEEHPVRRNVELVAELRDEAMHLVIEQVPTEVLSLFQACVVNYHGHLREWCGICLSERVPVGMMALVYDLAPDGLDLSNARLRRRMGAETADFLARYRAELQRAHAELGMVPEFAIDIEYKLALVKKPADADIVLGTGAGGQPTGVLEIAKDPARTHPHRQTEVIALVRERLAGRYAFNSHDVLCVARVHRVRTRLDFFYQGLVPGSPAQYSDAFVDWLVAQFERNPDFFQDARRRFAAARTHQESLRFDGPDPTPEQE